MKRLGLFIFLFLVFISMPMAYLAFRMYKSLDTEEIAKVRYFAETLLDEMEADLAKLVVTEESRDIDDPAYARGMAEDGGRPYIMGWFRNNPDGSFFTGSKDGADAGVKAELARINALFNQKRSRGLKREPAPAPKAKPAVMAKDEAGLSKRFVDRYLNIARSKKQKEYLGRQQAPAQSISPEKASRFAVQSAPSSSLNAYSDAVEMEEAKTGAAPTEKHRQAEGAAALDQKKEAAPAAPAPASPAPGRKGGFRAEMGPLQSVFIDTSHVFIFRRIVVDNQVYRQGFVILTGPFLQYMADTFFAPQPMAGFSRLTLSARGVPDPAKTLSMGHAGAKPVFSVSRRFPRPFSFLTAGIECNKIPVSAERHFVDAMSLAFGLIFVLGILVIYKSAKAQVELSERRAQFVSSVTHELKTPLTTIRMYIEMLQQGIGKETGKQDEYFRILESEGDRLSRLIQNVLDFARLERKNSRVNPRVQDLARVFAQAARIMEQPLLREKFQLVTDIKGPLVFAFDKELLVQVLVNLMENSIKFGKGADEKKITLKARREKNQVVITLSDTGPGIGEKHLKKIFRDFYRPDTPLTRHTGGTGIGLALVRRSIKLMNGSVTAKNNPGKGCSIIIRLPAGNGGEEADG